MQQLKKVWDHYKNLDNTAKQIFLDFIFVVTNLDPTVTGRLLPDPSSAANVPDPRPFVLQPRTEQVVAVRAAKEVWDHYIKLNEEAKQMFLDTISLVIKLDGDRIVVVPDYAQAATGAIWMGERLGGGGRHKKIEENLHVGNLHVGNLPVERQRRENQREENLDGDAVNVYIL